MKFYFSNEHNPERCFTREYWLDFMRAEHIKELELFEAKPDYSDDYFWCSMNGEIGEKYESCGKICADYSPRNHKSGRCKHSTHCYEKTDKIIKLQTK